MALPLGAVALRGLLPPWGFMWHLAASLFAGFKWLTWWRARAGASAGRSLAYLLLWPGMDAASFLEESPSAARPSRRAWVWAGAKTLLGIALLWGGVRLLPASSPILRGWVGLAGLVFLLHFGIAHLLALFWQERGVRAEPIMRAPIAARSLGDFWGSRWNLGFRDLAHPTCAY